MLQGRAASACPWSGRPQIPGRFFPEDVVGTYARLMADPDAAVRHRAAAAWSHWEDVVLSLEPGAPPVRDEPLDDAALAFVRLTTHYYAELLVDDRSGHRASDVKRAWKRAASDRFAG
jgi:proline iminopeptidase